MTNIDDNNFDGIDLNELFNDFHEKRSSAISQRAYDINLKKNQDNLSEFNEKDRTTPKITRHQAKAFRRVRFRQKTMYDYAASVSYKHTQFYSSLDNTIKQKTIVKEQKRSLTDVKDYELSSSKSKKPRTIDYDNSSSQTTPDLIDNLIRYLDERNRFTKEQSKDEGKLLKN